MTREYQLKYCNVCTKRSFNPKFGVVCSITQEVATFENTCPDFLEDEKEVILEKEIKKELQSDVNKLLNRGRIALFVVSGLYIFIGFLDAFTVENHHLIFGLIDWFIALVFIGIGIWSYRKPFLAMLIGLIFYVSIIAFIGLIDPSTLFSGIIWKLIVAANLIVGIKTAKEEEAKQKPVSVDILDQV